MIKQFLKKYLSNIILILGILATVSLTILTLNFCFPTIYAINTKDQPKMILIDIEDCKLFIIENGKCVEQYSISAGKYTTPSPLGFFKVNEKGLWGEGFGGYWIGLNVPWGKYGIHGTTSPESIGWHGSHGCFRLNNKNAKKVYKSITYGTKVLVINGTDKWFNNGIRTLKPTYFGGDVLQVQHTLDKLGYYNGVKNGKFTTELKNALNNFQKDNNLPIRNMIGTKEYSIMGITLDD